MGMLAVQLQLPPESAVVVQIGVEPSFTDTLALGSAVPTITGEVVLLMIAPEAGWVMLGAAGAVVSTVTGLVVGGLVLPAGSVAVTVTLCRPSVSGVLGMQFQVPFG